MKLKGEMFERHIRNGFFRERRNPNKRHLLLEDAFEIQKTDERRREEWDVIAR